jgi:carbonic anhydrase
MSVTVPGLEKILKGVLHYNKSIKHELVPFFREILDKPAPKSILITCVDSRIVASRILQSEPGAYFLLRNPGNFIPKYECLETSVPSGTAAALELACVHNNANTIGVIGHSDCKSLNMLFDKKDTFEEENVESSALNTWMCINGKDTISKWKEFEKSGFNKCLTFSETDNHQFEAFIDTENEFCAKDKFSQINTLEQLKNVNKYNFLQDKIQGHKLKGYALWLDVCKSEVYLFSYNEKRFVKIDEDSYEKLYSECQTV